MSKIGFPQMHFEMELQQDLPREIDELMRMDVLGNFKLGKRIFSRVIDDISKDGGIIPWPVLAEYLRFLYDQGNPAAVDIAVDQFLAMRKTANGREGGLNREQIRLLQVLQAVTKTNRFGATEENVENAQRRVTSALGSLVLSGMETLSEDEVWLLVLQTRVRYLEHEKLRQLPLSQFSLPWSKKRNKDVLCPWVTQLLTQGRFWAAQDVLEVCFRRAGRGTYRLDLHALWNAISRFIQLEDITEEAPLLAKMTVLQIYCEGLIRHGCDISRLQIWKTARDRIDSIEQCLVQILGKDLWDTSRPRLRLNMLNVDATVALELGSGKPARDMTGSQQLLEATMKQAHSNEDTSLYEAAKFRLAALMHAVNLSGSSTPPTSTGPFPQGLYIRWQKQSLESSDKKAYRGPAASPEAMRMNFTNSVSSFGVPKQFRVELHKHDRITKSVLFVGNTRSGKSTLISTLTDAFVPTSESMTPCTSAIEKQTVRLGEVDVECYDTPGFGDPRGTLVMYNVLEQIAKFLKDDYSKRHLQGVIFLIDIRRTDFDKGAKENLDILKAVLGEEAWQNTCIVFTKGCGVVSGRIGSRAREEKRQEDKRKLEWKNKYLPSAAQNAKFFDLGLVYSESDHPAEITAQSDTARRDSEPSLSSDDSDPLETLASTDEPDEENTPDIEEAEPHQFRPVEREKAFEILRCILDQPGPAQLQMQREMCVFEPLLNLPETSAGRLCHFDVLGQQDTRRGDLARVQLERVELNQQLREVDQVLVSPMQTSRQSVPNPVTMPLRPSQERSGREREERKTHIANRAEPRWTRDTDARAREEGDKMRQKEIEDRIAELEKENRRTKAELEAKEILLEKAKLEKARLERIKMEKAREEEAIAADLDILKAEINRIESSAGYVPRFLIHNKSEVCLHARAYTTPGFIVQNYRNNVLPGNVVSIPCSFGSLGIDICLDTGPTSAFITKGHVLRSAAKVGGASAAAIGLGTLVAGATTVASGGLVPVILGAVVLLAGYWPEGQQAENKKIALIAPTGMALHPEVQTEKEIMEKSIGGEFGLGLASYTTFKLRSATRLEITGGPRRRTTAAGSVEYVFSNKTKPLVVQQVDKFPES